MLTWGQLGLHNKPCAFLNTAGYYDKLLLFLQSALEAGFLKMEFKKKAVLETDPAALLDKLFDQKISVCKEKD